jgi:hypothetical protein
MTRKIKGALKTPMTRVIFQSWWPQNSPMAMTATSAGKANTA